MCASPITVLLAEDEANEARRVAAAARRSPLFELVHVRGVADAVQQLTHQHFDAVLLDLSLPGCEGLDALVRLHEHAPEVPMIVLAAEDDDTLAVTALKQGAQDSLVKSEIEGGLLKRTVRYAIERHQLQMALRAMSLVDDLTGLYNRRGFLTLARQQLKMAERMGKRVAQIFVDLDGLKWINDTFGHRAGDVALTETADLLRETFRDSDIVARIGGDEFAVLAMETSGSAVDGCTARLREALNARNARAGRRFPLALSIGVASYDPEVPCAIDDLLQSADEMMYADKRAKQRAAAGRASSADDPAPWAG